MEDFFCCPNCGSKKLQSEYQPVTIIYREESYLHWSCANCGNEFIDFSYYTDKINQLQKRGTTSLTAFIVLGGIFAFILYFTIATFSVISAILVALFILLLCVFLGSTLKNINQAAADKISDELQKIKTTMQKMNNKF